MLYHGRSVGLGSREQPYHAGQMGLESRLLYHGRSVGLGSRESFYHGGQMGLESRLLYHGQSVGLGSRESFYHGGQIHMCLESRVLLYHVGHYWLLVIRQARVSK